MASKNKGINIFRHVPKANLPKAVYPMQHSVKFDCEFGRAYPFFAEEVIATDTWHLQTQVFMRMNPTIAPVMHDFRATIHWFYVPTRLVWKECEEWYTGGRLGTWREEHPDAVPWVGVQFMMYQYGLTDTDEFLGTIWDFFGLNFGTDRRGARPYAVAEVSNTLRVDATYARTYWLIYEYFFRDANIIPEGGMLANDEALSSGEDFVLSDYPIQPFKVAWDKDYFTSACLTPQRGPQVYVPIGGSAPISATVANASGSTYLTVKNANIVQGEKHPLYVVNTSSTDVTNFGTLRTDVNNDGEYDVEAVIQPTNFQVSGTADLSNATGSAIDDVREAFALQRFFERMQVVGSRFAEYLRGIFGSNFEDYRLQMPEYLGTTVTPIVISNVPNQSASNSEAPQGAYAGNGMGASSSAKISKYFPEPGILMGLFVAMPRNGYQQGLARKLTRFDYTDRFNPYFQHIGEQPVMESELFNDATKAVVEDRVFGYQSQYASYKFINSSVHGNLKKSLDFWHAGRIFEDSPTLSREFIEFDGSESTDRLFALTEYPKFEVEIQCNITAERPITPYSTPSIQ